MKFQRRQGGPAAVAGRTDSSSRSERGAQCVSEQAGPDWARGLVKSSYFCGSEPADGSYQRNTDQQKLR
jgi:hypothetical protein